MALTTLGHAIKKTYLLKIKRGLIIHVKHAGENSGPFDQETQPQSYLVVSVFYSAGRSNLIIDFYIPFK